MINEWVESPMLNRKIDGVRFWMINGLGKWMGLVLMELQSQSQSNCIPEWSHILSMDWFSWENLTSDRFPWIQWEDNDGFWLRWFPFSTDPLILRCNQHMAIQRDSPLQFQAKLIPTILLTSGCIVNSDPPLVDLPFGNPSCIDGLSVKVSLF